MRLSSSFVAPSAVAILSSLLLSGPAVSQINATGPAQLPTVSVDAPKQVARPHRASPGAGSGASHVASSSTRAPAPAPGSVLAKIAAFEKVASSCNGGCATSFKTKDAPWVGCSESGGFTSTFSITCTDTITHKDYVDCMETKSFLGLDRNRAWWYCNSLLAGGKFKVAELKRPKRPH